MGLGENFDDGNAAHIERVRDQERRQRHGTASAHMIDVRRLSLSAMSSSRP
jgi:hypothetical protein